MSTNNLSKSQIQRTWQKIDAKDQVLGRLASGIAKILIGKTKASYVPNLDTGDYVVVVNAALVRVTGKKADQKIYFRHSGYPGGDKTETFKQLKEKKPEEIIKHAVKGMMPDTKLGKQMLKKLYIYPGEEHPYQSKVG